MVTIHFLQRSTILHDVFLWWCSVVDAARLTGWAKLGEIANCISEFEFCNNTLTYFIRKKFLFCAFGSFLFCEWVPRPSLFDTDILKFSTSSVPVNIFN